MAFDKELSFEDIINVSKLIGGKEGTKGECY